MIEKKESGGKEIFNIYEGNLLINKWNSLSSLTETKLSNLMIKSK